jgi:signal transduction histidine kinase
MILYKKKELEFTLMRNLIYSRLLNEIVRAIMDEECLETIFNVVVQNLEEHFPVDFASIWLCDTPCDFITIVANGTSSERIAEKMKLDKGTVVSLNEFCFRTMAWGKRCSVLRPGRREWLVEKFSEAGLPSLLVEPLMKDDRSEGFLVCGRKEGEEFLPGDKEFFKQLRGHLGLAFRQERLMRTLESASFELEKNQVEIAQHQQLRAMGETASGIVHDINNALSPILGYSSMMLESDLATHPKTKGYLQGIRTSAENISSVINTLKEFCIELREHETRHTASRIVAKAVESTTPRWKHTQQRQGLDFSKIE